MLIAIQIDQSADLVDIVLGLEYVVRVSLLDDEPVTYHRITEMGLLEVDKWDRIDHTIDPMNGCHLITIGHQFTIGVTDEGWDIVTLDGEQINGGTWADQIAFDVTV